MAAGAAELLICSRSRRSGRFQLGSPGNPAMRLLNRINISTKVFLGFGIVLFLLLLISVVSTISLSAADRSFKSYRSSRGRPMRMGGSRQTC